jgi:hypothetical protein
LEQKKKKLLLEKELLSVQLEIEQELNRIALLENKNKSSKQNQKSIF